MAINFGSDTYCISDIPLIDLQVTDAKTLVAQRLARRLTTPRGGLAAIGDEADFGWDVRQYVNGRMSPALLSQAQQQIAAECLKDEEVASCDVSMSFVNGGALTITLQVTTADGPFSLVLNVSQVSYTALVNT